MIATPPANPSSKGAKGANAPINPDSAFIAPLNKLPIPENKPVKPVLTTLSNPPPTAFKPPESPPAKIPLAFPNNHPVKTVRSTSPNIIVTVSGTWKYTAPIASFLKGSGTFSLAATLNNPALIKLETNPPTF